MGFGESNLVQPCEGAAILFVSVTLATPFMDFPSATSDETDYVLDHIAVAGGDIFGKIRRHMEPASMWNS